MNVATNILQANPDVQAIFAHNDEMALGAIQAAKSAGKTIFIVGFDGTADADKAVKDGTLAATIAQQPDQMGKIAIDTAQKVIKGEAVEAKIPVDLKVVTKIIVNRNWGTKKESHPLMRLLFILALSLKNTLKNSINFGKYV